VEIQQVFTEVFETQTMTQTPQTTLCSKPVIGLTGQIAAGKTLVSRFLSELGCVVIHADQLAHEVLNAPESREFIQTHFGEGIFTPDGQVDRRKMAAVVFIDPEKKRILEEYIHPRVIAHQDDLIAQYRQDAAYKAIVIEVPLLLESGLKDRCDYIILVEADLPVRQLRVAQNRGWDEKELLRREKFLYSIYLKRSVADAIVYNNSTFDACRQQVEKIFSRLISSVP
jgi:dephospho-CoA kinase